jgi:hypothetical protein
MATFTNDSGESVKLFFRKADRNYGLSSEVDFIDTPENTSAPFEEVIVDAGASFDMGEVTWSSVGENGKLVPDAQKSYDDYVKSTQNG